MMLRRVAPTPGHRRSSSMASPGNRPGGDVTTGGIDLHSRRVNAGALFLACRGASTHGLDFAIGARAPGIAAIDAEPEDYFGDRAQVLQERGGIEA